MKLDWWIKRVCLDSGWENYESKIRSEFVVILGFREQRGSFFFYFLGEAETVDLALSLPCLLLAYTTRDWENSVFC